MAIAKSTSVRTMALLLANEKKAKQLATSQQEVNHLSVEEIEIDYLRAQTKEWVKEKVVMSLRLKENSSGHSCKR